MTDTTDPRELLKSTLRELQELRHQVKAAEREKQERPAVIGAACRLPGASSFLSLAGRDPAAVLAIQEAAAFDGSFGLDETTAAFAPYLRLLLATGWEALEQAGLSLARLHAGRAGVFIGIGGSEPHQTGGRRILPALQSAQSLASALAIRGPAVNVDAGDASALAAIDLACRSLLASEIDVALAGGVALVENASGAAPAAGGCGLVVLKRLSDALGDHDGVLAVVRAHRVSFFAGDTTASIDQFSDLARLFPGEAGVDPQAVGYLGVGDSRLEAGSSVVAAQMEAELHSADAGHLNGMVAFLNAVLAVQPGKNNNAAGAIAAGRDSLAAVAVSAPMPVPDADDPGPYLLFLSAPDGPGLEPSARRVIAQLQLPAADLASIAYDSRAGQAHLPHRRCLVVESREQAIAGLNTAAGAQAVCERTGRPLVFLFPGLGSHYLNMAHGLYRRERLFKDVVDQCARLLQPHLGIDIRALIFTAAAGSGAHANSAGQFDLRKMLRRSAGPADPAAARLDQTIHAQPALFVIEYSLARLLASWGIRPAAMMGYSLGEYVAACLAGVVSLEGALFLVATRARLIQALPAGKMIAVPLSEAELAPLLGAGDAAISAVNGPAVCIVAGEPRAIDALAARLAQDDIAAQMLPTTHAFHTAMLSPVAKPFLEALESVDLNPPAVPYISNLTGDWITAAEATSPEYWLEHSCRPVRFAAGIESLQRAGYDLIVEVGPSPALSSLVTAAVNETGATMRAVPTMRYDYDNQSDTVVLHKALGELWLAGADIDWDSFHPVRRTVLSATSFERHPPAAGAAPGEAAHLAEQADRPPFLPQATVPLAGTPTELALAALWRDVLKLPDVDPHRTFFQQGGNSLLAAKLVFRIKKARGVELPLRAVFEAPGLAALARLIDGYASEAAGLPPDNDAAFDIEVSDECLPVTLPNGLAILCQNKHEVDHFYEDIFIDRVYVSHGITLPTGAVVFDVGANIGLFSLFSSIEAPGVRIFAFEPAPPLFRLLQANLERHGVSAVLHRCGLSSRPGTAELTFYPKSSGMSSLYADLDEEKAVLETVLRNQMRRGESELEPLLAHVNDYLAERFKAQRFSCRLRTLSEVIAEAGLERIDLLKIDVQKAELDVLLGLDERDWPKVRQVVIEVHDVDARLARMRQMLEQMVIGRAAAAKYPDHD